MCYASGPFSLKICIMECVSCVFIIRNQFWRNLDFFYAIAPKIAHFLGAISCALLKKNKKLYFAVHFIYSNFAKNTQIDDDYS